MTEGETRVVVARARIEDGPRIDVCAPKEIRVRAHQPLRVQYQFRVEESSKSKEEWRFRLTSSVGDQTKPATQSEWQDRFGRPDDFWGLVEHTFTFDKPGKFAAGFTVNAEHDQSPWGRKKAAISARREVHGNFLVRVDP